MSNLIAPSIDTAFPYIREKLVIDFLNGLHVAREQNNTRHQQSGLLVRFLNGLSGTEHTRQTHINDHVLHGLDACHNLILELSHDMTHNAVVLHNIHEHIQHAQQHIATLTQNNIALRQEFDCFVKQTRRDLHGLNDALAILHRTQRAECQLDRLITKWMAGGLANLSPLGRCYAVLDTLYRGEFGRRIRMDGDNENFISALHDKIVVCLSKDLNATATQDIPRDQWQTMPESIDKPALIEALQYQGDWCLSNPAAYSTTYVATQQPSLQAPSQEKQICFRNMISIQRVTQRMIRDLFDKERTV